MNILEEIEAARQRIIREINAEFDRMADSISRNSDNITAEPIQYEITYPITADSGIFKGKKPISVIIGGERTDVKTWKEIVKVVMEKCIESNDNIIKLYQLAGKISGQKRVLLANSGENMRSPIEITNHLYMETHYDTETLLKILITRILAPIGYNTNEISVVIRRD